MATMSELLEENRALRKENEKLRASLRDALECIEQAVLASRRLDDMVGELTEHARQKERVSEDKPCRSAECKRLGIAK